MQSQFLQYLFVFIFIIQKYSIVDFFPPPQYFVYTLYKFYLKIKKCISWACCANVKGGVTYTRPCTFSFK